MKRIGIVLAVLLMTTAFAQATEIGFQGGLNLANLSGDVSENDMLLAFGGGAFAGIQISPGFCIQPEILYMMKGTKWKYEEGGLSIEEKLKLNYIEIPILFKYQFPTEGSVSPVLFAGPALSLLMSAKADVAGIEIDVKDFFKSSDFGLVIGGGADFKAGEKGKFIIVVRYTLGLSNLNDDDDFPDDSIKNGVFSIFAGYAFGIGP